ncbi:MAG TPA: D-glycerate dehydrogenase [Burkholderiaceae bacterium]|jgi:glyoxylate reductase|nr:D-glycerate dehydrogenase [Burkholderiaceae bacterium]
MSETRPRVVVTRRIFPELIDALRARYDLHDNQEDAALAPPELARRLRDADGALITGGDRIDGALLAACPRLKVVSNIAVGYNNIDLAACTAHGVVATNTPDVLNEATADHAWALLLAAARRVGEAERWLRAGQWKRWEFEALMGVELYGKTLGIIGLGRIGRAIARRGTGFAMRVVYHNRTRLAPELEGGAEYRTLEALLAEADHLIVVVPYSPATHHLIGARELALLKPTAVLVNIARGGVVDDAALIEALRARRLFAAGLDVFENEPALNPGFLTLENVVLTPHIASSTRETRAAMAQLAIRNLDDALAGRRPAALLNPEVWERRRT